MSLDDTQVQSSLRAEWLRLRGFLWDSNTGLPALPAVIDRVRRRMEDGDDLGLVFLDLTSEEGLEQIYGWETFDKVLHQVAGVLQEIGARPSNEVEAIALAGIRSDEFLVFLASRGKVREREKKLRLAREEILAELNERLQIQIDTELPRGLQIHAGHTFIPFDPTVRIERLIYRSIDRVKALCRREREKQHSLRLGELRRIIKVRDLQVRFQPIVHLENLATHGHEALSSAPPGSVFESAETLFSFAEETDVIGELERLCCVEAIRGWGNLPRHAKLFVNCSAHSFEDPLFFTEKILPEVEGRGARPQDLVFEITERVAIQGWVQFRQVLDGLRTEGFEIAVDDMGAGYSSLHSVAEIQPDYLKVDISLVRDIHRHRIKQNMLETLVTLAGKINSRVIAEGVEQEEELELLRSMGVELAQGFLLSPPDSLQRHRPIYHSPDGGDFG